MFEIGTDILEINRLNKKLNNKFLSMVYSEKELELYKNNTLKLASNFAAKEAVAKVLGEGFSFFPKEIEIFRDSKGKPFVILNNRALELSKELNISKFNLSISHSRDYVVAFCMGERKNES